MSNDTKNPYPDKCPIWGTPAQFPDTNGDRKIIVSPRTGGRYSISGSALACLRTNELAEEDKKTLTNWLVRQRRLGTPEPSISSQEVEIIPNLSAPSEFDRLEAMLLYVKEQIPDIGGIFELDHPDGFNEMPEDDTYYEMLAHTSSSNRAELGMLLDWCVEQGWFDNGRWSATSKPIIITIDGYNKINQILNPDSSDSKTAFVAMWFDDDMKDIFEKGIKPAIEQAGYLPFKIDLYQHNNQIDDEIIASIRRSHFMVADFTQGKDGARGNVYFEAGFAKGLGIEVIFTCKDGDESKLHFDTRQYNHLRWKNAEDFRKQLLARISATIGDGPVKH